MKIELFGHTFNLSNGFDLSIPISEDGPRAWYVDAARIEPVMTERFVGSVAAGGAVNFRNVIFNPHGHGTHTENAGHIVANAPSVIQSVTEVFYLAQVVTVNLEEVNGDLVVTHFNEIMPNVEALIVRTKPNDHSKLNKIYSGTNFPYVSIAAIEQVNASSVRHFLIDLPSIDREEDGGALAAHHLFWDVPKDPKWDKTITEFIYVSNEIEDGLYALNLQVANFKNDAAPSRPLIFGR
jgi:arylformamidase